MESLSVNKCVLYANLWAMNKCVLYANLYADNYCLLAKSKFTFHLFKLCYFTIADIVNPIYTNHFKWCTGNLASIYYEQGQLDMAILHYKQVVACAPKFLEAYNNLVGFFLCHNWWLKNLNMQFYVQLYNILFDLLIWHALKDVCRVEEAIQCYNVCFFLILWPYMCVRVCVCACVCVCVQRWSFDHTNTCKYMHFISFNYSFTTNLVFSYKSIFISILQKT